MATAAAIGRTLTGAGLTWHDLTSAILVVPPSTLNTRDQRTMIAELSSCGSLTDWEATFVMSLACTLRRGRRLSEKQTATLKRIYDERIGGAE
ncbi:MAG: hypothetical protein H7840_14625 [Alphaproteobacteria bacterium]